MTTVSLVCSVCPAFTPSPPECAPLFQSSGQGQEEKSSSKNSSPQHSNYGQDGAGEEEEEEYSETTDEDEIEAIASQGSLRWAQLKENPSSPVPRDGISLDQLLPAKVTKPASIKPLLCAYLVDFFRHKVWPWAYETAEFDSSDEGYSDTGDVFSGGESRTASDSDELEEYKSWLDTKRDKEQCKVPLTVAEQARGLYAKARGSRKRLYKLLQTKAWKELEGYVGCENVSETLRFAGGCDDLVNDQVFGNEYITLTDWLLYFTKKCAEGEATMIYAAADRNGDGLLSKREVKAVFTGHEKWSDLSGVRYAAMFEELDADNDGTITAAEWTLMFTSRAIEAAANHGDLT